jgi:DTW domain-containing protein YfiP
MNTPRRVLCARCHRPQSACICAWATPTANEARVLILQHPLEVKQAKGSARLLQLSLQHAELHVGESFDPLDLQAWLDADKGSVPHTVLLYPAHPDLPCAHATLDGVSPGRVRLVVLDGTWRKSLKMLHLNPALQALPRLALQPDAPSRYLIRKAHRPDQLSTLEATCLALAQLEAAPDRYTPLLTAFSAFVKAQAQRATAIGPVARTPPI